MSDPALRLAQGGPERRAIEAGEIDAVIDHAGSNVILLPAARRALRQLEKRKAPPRPREAPIANSLLAALPRAEYRRLLPGLEARTLRLSETLQEAGAPVRHVYFPVDCVISLLSGEEGPRRLQVALVGRDGMLGVALALDSRVSSVCAEVQVAGTALRMNAGRFLQDLRQCPELRRLLCRYAHAKLAEARRTIACNGFHGVEARIARWLLTMSDRALSPEFFLTQAALSRMLGVRRATVNEAAGPLQQRGLITCARGKVRIVDRTGLAAAACSCYASLAAHDPGCAGNRRAVSRHTTS